MRLQNLKGISLYLSSFMGITLLLTCPVMGVNWNMEPAARRASFRDTQWLNFSAASCIGARTDDLPHEYVFFIDLEVDTDATVMSAMTAYARASAEIVEFSVTIENGCATCTDPVLPQPMSSGGGG